MAEGVDGQRPRAGIDLPHHLIQPVVAAQRQDGAKDLTLHQQTVGRCVQHDVRRDLAGRGVEGRAGQQGQHGGAPLAGVVQRLQQPLEAARVDDAGVVGRGQAGVARRHDGLGQFDELADACTRQPGVVHRGADLAGVQALDEQDAFGRQLEREVVADDGRRLAAEFQRHRAQVGRRRGHHRATGGARAGEQQMVELELGERHADTAGLVEELQFLGRKVGRHLVDQEPRQVARVLAHLDHRTVAGSEDVAQWHHAQVERKVPRHDHAHHAQRLRDDTIARPEEVAQVHRAALRLHPVAQVLDDVVDAVHGRKDLGQLGLMPRAVAVVGADGFAQRRLVLAHETLQRAQVGLALVQAGHRVGQVGLALGGQGGVEDVEQRQIGQVHGGSRWQGSDAW